MKRIGVIGVPGGWSSERLADAVARRTGFRCLIDLERLRFDLSLGRPICDELSRLDAVIIKKIGSAYTPQQADRLRLLDLVFDSGLKMYSRPARILRAHDRLSCTLALCQGRVPIPSTVVTEDLHQALATIREFEAAVLKPLYTSKGRGMFLVRAGSDALEFLARFQALGNKTLYIQKLVPLPGRDLGVVFLGGQYLATYARVREKDAWSTTTHSGGRYEPHHPTKEVLDVAQRAQDLFELDFTCVDVAECPDGPKVFEVSAFGGFRGLLQAHGTDAADQLAEYVFKRLEGA